MKDLLLRCFYDGMKKEDAIAFIEKSYNKKVSERSVKSAVELLKKQNGVNW